MKFDRFINGILKRDSPLQGQPLFILTILVVGLSGIVAQVLLLRELLVSFYGNELTIGVILANWIILEAAGVFIGGKFISRIKEKINVVVFLQIIFFLTLPLSIYLGRTFKGILGLLFGEALGLPAIFYVSLLVILPVALCHGALFSVLCKIYSADFKESAVSIGRVYSWETVGTIVGGLIFTYLFLPYLNSFQIAFIILLANILLFLLFKDISKLLKATLIFLIVLVIIFSFSGGINYLQRISVNKQWRFQQVLDYRNSVHGNIVVTKEKEQYTFFYNGIPIITAPHPDRQFVQEFGNLPLLFHNDPQDILVIGSGAGGLLNEILRHPVRKLDYAELDPLIIRMVRKYNTALTDAELRDARTKIKYTDGRFLIRTSQDKYDVILMGLSKPQDLSINRLFTQEFFSLVKKRLNPQGIFAFCLPGSLSYISQELKDLNACILNSLKQVFSYVRIIPGDYNMFLVSDNVQIVSIDAPSLVQRMKQRQIKAEILLPSYLEYRLDRRWLEWFKQSQEGATKMVNQDLRPFAVFQMLLLWNKQFSPFLARIFAGLKNLNFAFLALAIILLVTILLFIFRKSRFRLGITYAIFTTGFFGMLANLILIFSFQVYYGYLYYKIGLLLSVFMGGIASASLLITRHLEKFKDTRKLLLKMEVAIAIFSGLLAIIIPLLASAVYTIFMVLFFSAGFLVGTEFPLAAKLYTKEKEKAGHTAGVLYAVDLLGGWLAGIFGGIVFLPILGLLNTCLIIVIFKLSSIFLLMTIKEPT